jgi:hypothetical protein
VLFEDTLLQSEAVAYIQHRKEEPGAWIIGKTGSGSGLWDRDQPDTEALAFDLTSCLPVPSPSVPIETILTFKEKRRAELYAFRTHMDSLRQEILSASDRELRMLSAMEHLDKAISDLNRSMSESFSTSIVRKVRSLVAVGAQAGLGSWTAPPTHKLLGAGLGALVAAVTISMQNTKTPIGTPHGEPFAYIQSVVELDVRHR